MYYTIYKITNQINGKFYIGSHKTKDLDDNYYGSGKYLKRAIEKYGIKNFTKEILHVFDNPEEMYAKEAEIVNEDFLAEENTYNLKVGGFGGWDYINDNPDKYLTDKRLNSLNFKWTKERFNEKMKADSSFATRIKSGGLKGSRRINELYPEGTFKGKTHSDETKDKMSRKAKERLKDPTKNSQYGTRWIHSLTEQRSMKIKKDDPIPEGWLAGRKMKFNAPDD